MKNLGIVRHLDDLGRVTLPKELRKTFGIADGDPVEIFTDNNTICIKPVPKAVCMACGGTENLIEKGGKHICCSCLEGFAEEAEDLIEVGGHKLCHKCADKVAKAYEEVGE